MTGAHVLACGLCSNSGLPWTGWDVFGVFVTVVVILAAILGAAVASQHRAAAGKPPREPAADMSPFMAELLSGRRMASYSAPVRAVTPGGIAVRYGRCCERGHQSPQQAVTHAGRIAHRIEVTGR